MSKKNTGSADPKTARKSAARAVPAPVREFPPMDIDVKINSIRTNGNTAAHASVTLGGCFAVRGVKVVNGQKGLFVSMPGYSTQKGYKDVCFPCTQEFHKQFQEAVLHAYRQELKQLHESQDHTQAQQREAPGPGTAPEERAAPGPASSEEAPPGPEEESPSLGDMAMRQLTKS